MQLKTYNILGSVLDKFTLPDTHLSFKPFLDFVRARLQNESLVKKELLSFVLEKFKPYPELEEVVSIDNLEPYKHLFDLLHVVLSNVLEDERKLIWGLSVPMTPLLFYGSTPFYELTEAANTNSLLEEAGKKEVEYFINNIFENFYAGILKRFYGIELFAKGRFLRNVKDTQTQLMRHYKFSTNTDFVDIKLKGALPTIDIELLRKNLKQENPVKLLQELLPISLFSFSGFTVIKVTDITQEYALSAIRENIVKGNTESHTFPAVVKSLKEMVNSSEVEFNILPLFRINGKLVDNIDSYCQSIMFSGDELETYQRKYCYSLVEKIIEEATLLFYNDLDKAVPISQHVATILKNAGVKSYSLLPVFHNQKLVGALEVYSKKKGILDEKLLGAIEPAKTLLAQLMQNSLDDFDKEIDAVIKEKFTSLQPSVQWKFNEVALHYIQKVKEGVVAPEPEKIIFNDVAPLYGGIDIRNSTIERNTALHKDLAVQFKILIEVLTELKAKTGFILLDEKIFEAEKWAEMIHPNASLFNQQFNLANFLENDIANFLMQVTHKQPEAEAIARKYFDAINEKTGNAHQYKRALEQSMTAVVSFINKSVTQFKDEVLQAYPCYFEKFRTDGVEYDIYIGQFITPNKPYNEIFLKNLRLMQLKSMAIIAQQTHAMLPQLATPVETTQLIFVHSNKIDIRFRRDEKRFDVEGAYNIRYHIIKKRIDKVHILGTDERLTQPQKIAIVYFNEKEAEEYKGYIHYLKGQGILNDDLEQLDLEELQGVLGLKALRVGVRVE